MTTPEGAPTRGRSLFDGYTPLPNIVDEVFEGDGHVRPPMARVVDLLDRLGRTEFNERRRLADGVFIRHGVTFSVNADGRGFERILPFDPVPRIISAADWEGLDRGLRQRVQALNLFLRDIYGDQRILAEKVIPRRLVEEAKGYRREIRGVRPPGGVYVHIAGVDLVRRPDGEFVVLEDNLRTPSGVSYVLENRAVMKRAFPGVFQQARVRLVDEYPTRLKEALVSVAPSSAGERPRIVILTPGPNNAAYFEHSFLARRMGCDLVQGRDLFVLDDRVFLRTTRGPSPVDVIYRRIDDDYLDPDVFRSDSSLGVRGLMRAYRAGHLALANAVGNGIADDKALYPSVPAMIRFYLDERPILRQVQTYLCHRAKDRKHVLANLKKLVVKAVDEAGGYGMLVGPQATRQQLAAFRRLIERNPRRYVAQPVVELSTCPTWVGRAMQPRRVDLRPFVLTGKKTWVLPGGLTRVALRKGSYVVNSSQGGGSKDTWVLEGDR